VVFALSPGTAAGRGVNNLINYITKTGTEVAETATTKVSVEYNLDRKDFLNCYVGVQYSKDGMMVFSRTTTCY
jgi:hypothetical protein